MRQFPIPVIRGVDARPSITEAGSDPYLTSLHRARPRSLESHPQWLALTGKAPRCAPGGEGRRKPDCAATAAIPGCPPDRRENPSVRPFRVGPVRVARLFGQCPGNAHAGLGTPMRSADDARSDTELCSAGNRRNARRVRRSGAPGGAPGAAKVKHRPGNRRTRNLPRTEQRGSEDSRGVAARHAGHILWRALRDYGSASVAALGPRSMIQSAVLITSRLCSITMTVLPCSTSRCKTSRSLATSCACSPVVGSSSM